IDDIQKLQKALKTADDIKESVEKLEKEYKDIKNNFSDDYEQSRKSLKQVDKWIKSDYERARSMAKLPDFSVGNIGMMLFGEQAAGRFNTYLGYAATARKYANKTKSDKPEKVKPPRLKGQDIPFPDKNARPDFWIKRLSLSGQTSDQLKLKGEVINITDNQQFIGKPTEADISGTRDDGAQLSLNAVFDYRNELPMETYNVNFTGFSMANTQLSKSSMLPNKLKTGTGNVLTSLKLEGESIKGKIDFVGDKLVFEFNEAKAKKNKIEQIIRDVLEGIKKIEFIAYVSGTRDDLDFRLSSNLDEEISKGLKASIAKEIEAARKKIEQRIDKEVGKYREQLDEVVKDKEAQLKAELDKYQEKVDQQRAKVDAKKKEIEDKIDSEKKKLEKKAKNKLKNLLN
ncbi:MAG TPA: TIGR03545 family protein, partial [Caldithrix sp.]|nr:TIGR03545 family protein [Caldithrix sp.]